MRELAYKLLHDLRELGINTEGFELVLRPFSKTYFGRYVVAKKRIIIYVYSDPDRKSRYKYSELMKVLIHEVIHHIQHENPDFIRYKGIMHDAEFKAMYEHYLGKYYRLRITRRLRR